LKGAAHKIRLGGNRGAHPEPLPNLNAGNVLGLAGPQTQPSEPITKIEKEHAEAIVEFTRHFFESVYVIPAKVGKYDFSKPKPVAQVTKP
jgi:hypothetical protein